jgi:hypothetical protein
MYETHPFALERHGEAAISRSDLFDPIVLDAEKESTPILVEAEVGHLAHSVLPLGVEFHPRDPTGSAYTSHGMRNG